MKSGIDTHYNFVAPIVDYHHLGRAEPKVSKHRNVPRRVDGYWFASGREARRYQELKLLEYAGEISELKLQPRYKLVVNKIPICTYVADFRYLDRDEKEVVEDAKGRRLPLYKAKKALMMAVYGIDVKEV